MGKDPGKWIKTLFSGKKSSKSNRSSKRNNSKPSSNQDVLASIEASLSYIPDSSLISPPTSGADASTEVLLEKVVVSESSNDSNIVSAGVEDNNAEAVNLGSPDDVEKVRLAEAVIKVQAGFRGYQARQAFQTLKGAIQLQALIRGDLVRRQAVSTLYCVKGIVKVQAFVRGQKVRHSDIGVAVLKTFKDTKCSNSTGVVTTGQAEKLPTGFFVNQLLASSYSTVPLHLNFDPGEPNFTWKWLVLWTRSNFWAPLPIPEKKHDLKSNEKSANCLTFENNKGKPKRNVKKASRLKVDDGSMSESNTLKQPAKKASMQSSQEHPQNETKSHIKKTSTQSFSNRSEVAPEKKKHIAGKPADHAGSDVSEHRASVSADKIKNSGVSKSKHSDLEKSPGLQAKDENGHSHNNPVADSQTSVKNGKEAIQEDGEDLKINVNPQNSLRRASLPASFNDQDNNSSHNTPRVPSYMAPTESAKAKLRAQGSPRFAGDFVDKTAVTRRHSLTTSLNGRFSSFSPRTERLLNTSSRGVTRTDRSLSSLRDGTEKFLQPRWRR